MLFTKRLKEFRKAAHLTQQELGSKVFVSKSSISSYENGTKQPKLETLVLLADVFHTSIDQLLGKDLYMIAENDQMYGISLAKEELVLIQKIRNRPLLYQLLVDKMDPTLDEIERKIR